MKLIENIRANKSLDIMGALLIVISIIFVIYSYLPTLTQDYVAEDQLRAFNYSISTTEASIKANECYQRLTPFFTRTGRPLTWIGECIEHSFVNQINDFRWLRQFNVLLAVITHLLVAFAIFICIRNLSVALLSSTTFVILPGYSFMYYQGLTAMMVMIAPIISIFGLIIVDFGRKSIIQHKIHYLLFCLFIVIACFMYAAWAFVSLSLVVAISLVDLKEKNKNKLLYLFRVAAAQLTASIIYFIVVKIMIKLNFMGAGILKDIDQYEFTLNNFIPLLSLKLSLLFDKIMNVPLFNTDLFSGAYFYILVAAYLINILYLYKIQFFKKQYSVTITLAFFVLTFCLMIGSVSPWLVSGKTVITNMSYLLPLGLFFAIIFSGCLNNILSIIRPDHQKSLMLFFAVCLTSLFSVIQHNISDLEVETNNEELNLMRKEIGYWNSSFSSSQQNLLLIVHPHRIRSSKIENMNLNNNGIDINLRLLTASEPVDSSRWLINAVLREQEFVPEIIKNGLYDCGFDKSCANIITESNKIGILHTYPEDFPTSLAVNPYIINLTSVTKDRFNPSSILIEKIALPKISASSQYDIYGPERINTQLTPAWYSEIKPKFPQDLVSDLRETKPISRITIGGEINYPLRFPSNIDLWTSLDGQNWAFYKSFVDLCKINEQQPRVRLDLIPSIKARYVKLSINKNCGDESLLSLQDLLLE